MLSRGHHQLLFLGFFSFRVLAYLQSRLAKERGPKIKTLTDMISFHREEHFENLLKRGLSVNSSKRLPRTSITEIIRESYLMS